MFQLLALVSKRIVLRKSSFWTSKQAGRQNAGGSYAPRRHSSDLLCCSSPVQYPLRCRVKPSWGEGMPNTARQSKRSDTTHKTTGVIKLTVYDGTRELF